MQRMPLVKTFMTPFPFSVAAQASLAEALAFMRKEGIRHLPVSSDGDLVGLITDRDIKLLLGPEFASPDADTVKVSEAMLPDPYTVDLNTPLDIVLNSMVDRHIGSAIVTRKRKLAGMFTGTDACRALATLLTERFGSGGDEAA